MKNLIAVISVMLASCGYDASFSDCTTGCSTGVCPGGLECRERVCRLPGATGSCTEMPGDGAVDTPSGDAAIDAPNSDAAIDAPQPGIALDPATSSAFTMGSSVTWQHTVGSTPDRLLVVGVSIEAPSGATVMGITFAGATLTRQAFRAGGSDVRAELWYLKAPQPGLHDVVATFSTPVGPDGAIVGAVSLSGVDQNTPLTTVTNAGDATTSPSTTITTANANAWIVDVVVFDSSSKMLNVSTGQTERWRQVQPSLTGVGSTRGPVPPSTTLTTSWTTPNGQDFWAQIVAEIKPR